MLPPPYLIAPRLRMLTLHLRRCDSLLPNTKGYLLYCPLVLALPTLGRVLSCFSGGEMPGYAVIGGQWGDEGKGKIIDFLAGRVDAVVRYGGGSNAGHTVVNDNGTFQLHMVPSGVC